MIEKCEGYKVGERFFPCIEEAQSAELTAIFEKRAVEGGVTGKTIAGMILDNQEHIVQILLGVKALPPLKKRKKRKDAGIKRGPMKAAVKADPAPPADSPGVAVTGSGKYKGK